MMDLYSRIEAAIGRRPKRHQPLHGGMIGEVSLVTLGKGDKVVVKTASPPKAGLDIEGYMLGYLADHTRLPLPRVLYCDDTLLIMTYIDGISRFGTSEQNHAAELVAALHEVTWIRYGLERDTLIGSLHQPNPPTKSWVEFFRDHRLLHMARATEAFGALPAQIYGRIEKLAARLDDFLFEPEAPSLLHGDLWTTNILAKDGLITGFLDPAVYYGHNEIELAFTTLFVTFDQPFFRRYNELRPIERDFFKTRRDLYNLYPLLVHVHLFGGSYVASVEATLYRLGF
jgi:fructosamine-3-kinase